MEHLPAKEVMDPNKYRSCAIVGSSDNLLRQFLGDEINDHDLIIRFNGATTKVRPRSSSDAVFHHGIAVLLCLEV